MSAKKKKSTALVPAKKRTEGRNADVRIGGIDFTPLFTSVDFAVYVPLEDTLEIRFYSEEDPAVLKEGELRSTPGFPPVVYSNCDHIFDREIKRLLTDNPGMVGSHTAYNFCAFIKFDGERWHSEVMRYREVVGNLEGDTIEEVVREANERWGDD